MRTRPSPGSRCHRGSRSFPRFGSRASSRDSRRRAGEQEGGGAQPGAVADVLEAAVAALAKEPVALVREVRDQEVRTTVVVVVGEVDSHPREGLSVLVVPDAQQQADLGEGAISVVVE